MHKEPLISVVLPAYNESKYIRECMLALMEQDLPKEEFEIIVVDNGSNDDTVSIAKEFTDKVYIKADCNVGAVRNYGVSHAKGEIIVFMDSDCLAPRSLLSQSAALVKSQEDTAFGGVLRTRDNPNWIEKYWLLENEKNESGQKDLVGGYISLPKQLFTKAGLFDESITSGEDSDLSHRIKRVGGSVVITPKLYVTHLGNPTTTKEFLLRQIWHSENYATNIQKSLTDPTFLLTITFLISFTLIPILLVTTSSKIAVFSTLTLLSLTVLITSVKRMIVRKYITKSLFSILKIISLDFLYLSGRSIGFIKGILKYQS